MKKNCKSFSFILALSLVIGLLLSGCKKEPKDLKIEVDEIRIMLLPSGNIETVWGNLKLQEDVLKAELASRKCYAGKVTILAGNSAEEVLEALNSGETDVGFLPASYYQKAREGQLKTALVALNAQGEDFRQVELYASKNMTDTELTFEKLNAMTIAVCHVGSLEGFIAFDNWLQSQFKKGVRDLANTVAAQNPRAALELLYGYKCSAVACYRDTFLNSGDLLAKYEGEGAALDDYYQPLAVLGTVPGDLVCFHVSDKLPNAFTTILGESLNSFYETEGIRAQLESLGHYGYREFTEKNYTLLK